jgi:N-acetylmuramoyl-L-alanine amidase
MILPKIKRKETKYIIIHCSDSTPSEDLTVCDLNKLHRQKGFLNIRFHLIIKRDGSIEAGRDIDEVGSHTEDLDDQSVSICLIGGVETNKDNEPRLNYTARQWETLRNLVKSMCLLYPEANVVGFNEVDTNKVSPYFDVQAWFDF